MKKVFYLFLVMLFVPFLLAQHLPINDRGTTSAGGEDGGGQGGFAPLILINPSDLNYAVSLPHGEEMILKNNNEYPNAIVVLVQTEDWFISSHTFRLEAHQEMNFIPSAALSPIKTIHLLSMQPFEVVLRDDAPLIGSPTETILQAQTSAESFDLNFIEDASGQVIPVGVMEDGSVHYPLFGKRIGMIENDAVLIDGTQQRFELLE